MGENKPGQTPYFAVRLRAREWWHTARLRAGQRVTPPSGEPEPESEPEPQVPAPAPGSPLYQHSANRHQPRNINNVHRAEQQSAGFNTRVAVWLTKNDGMLQCEISAI